MRSYKSALNLPRYMIRPSLPRASYASIQYNFCVSFLLTFATTSSIHTSSSRLSPLSSPTLTPVNMPAKPQVILTAAAPKPIPQLSQALKYNGMVYCSGSIGLDPKTSKVVEGTVQDRTVSPVSRA